MPVLNRYILFTTDLAAKMVAVEAAEDMKTAESKTNLISFWSEQSFDEVFAKIEARSKEFGLVQVKQSNYHTSDGAVSGILNFIS